MIYVLLVIHFFIALFLVGVILIQRSEGGALGGLGSGAGGLMSARGSANLLTRVTAVLAAAFFLSSVGIAVKLRSPDQATSILDAVEEATGLDLFDGEDEAAKEETPAAQDEQKKDEAQE